jgi:SPX domain protein involved in polyphosphate accumulation
MRDFISAHLEPDENCLGRPNYSYPIHSLYLDSEGLALYWETIRGAKNRYKLRLRFYEDTPDAPVYLEIKRRMADAILKQRGALRRDAVERLLAGQLPGREHLLSDEPKHVAAIHRFCQSINAIHARPTVHVAYLREAWVSPTHDSVRVTMDRQTRASVEPSARLTMEMDRPVRLFDGWVVLELKFTSRFPTWFGELVQAFDLQRGAAAKYADGVTLLGEHRFQGSFVPPPLARSMVESHANESPNNVSEKPA